MRKDFVKVMLFGALALSTVTFVGCKDYDDDIKNLQEQIDANKTQIASLDAAIKAGKWVKEYTATNTGYELILSDGSKLILTNGAKGEQGDKGDKGDTGLQGVQGPAGESVIPTFRVNGEYWQYSVDNGKTWIDVKNENGNPVKAKGEDGKDATSNVTWQEIDGVSYIKIGDVLTDLKAVNKFPVMIADETSKTVAVTIDGQTYTLLMEGSAFNGLQTIVYRRQAKDDMNDVVKAYYLVYKQDATAEDTLMIPAVGAASFKVYPGDWDPSNASFSFIDTYKTRAADAPAVKYLDGSAKVNGNILSILVQPANFEGSTNYATSLDVTMYKQYVSASDYFNIQIEKKSQDDLKYYETPSVNGTYTAIAKNQQQDMVSSPTKAHFCFEYNESYNLNDSIDVLISGVTALNDLGIDYKIEYSFTDKNWADQPVDNGIFELKDGILTVKKEYQSSAIHEYAYIKAKCTIKSQVEGVKDMVLLQNLAIFAGHNIETGNVELTLNTTVADQKWNMDYSAEPQYLVLDVRKFEAEMGGRDLLNPNNSLSNSWVKPLYADYKIPASVTNNVLPTNLTGTIAEVASRVSAGNIVLFFKAAPQNSTTSLDSLFLIVGKGTKLDAAKLWMAAGVNSTSKGKVTSANGSGAINKYIYVKNMSITRTPTIEKKSAYTEKIVGKYTGTTTADWAIWNVISENMYDVYNYTPTDMNVGFALATSQNDYVKELINAGKLEFTTDNKIVITPTDNSKDGMVDIAKIGNIYLNAYDRGTKGLYSGFNPTTQIGEISLNAAKLIVNKGDRTWTVQNPYKAVTSKGTITYTDPTLAKNSTYASYTKNLKDALLKDAYDKELFKGSEMNPFLTISDYAKKVYGFDTWEFSIKNAASYSDWTINATTGLLTCNKENIGAGYSISIPVVIEFPSNFGRPCIEFNVTIKNAAE